MWQCGSVQQQITRQQPNKYIKRPIWQYQQISIYHITFSETSLLRQGVSNHRQINCVLNSLFRTTSRTTSKLRIIILLCVETTTDRWFPSQTGQLCCKCRHVPASCMMKSEVFRNTARKSNFRKQSITLICTGYWFISGCKTKYPHRYKR